MSTSIGTGASAAAHAASGGTRWSSAIATAVASAEGAAGASAAGAAKSGPPIAPPAPARPSERTNEIVELKEWDAVRVSPGTWRGYEAAPGGLEIIVIGAPNLGEDPRGDVEGERDWWAD